MNEIKNFTNKKVLVVGGCGYIGSHTVYELIDNGYEVEILDNLSNGHLEVIPKNIKVFKLDLLDFEALKGFLENKQYVATMHFAAFIEVGESQENPLKYYQNNLTGSLNLIRAMKETGHNNLIFSSTAAIFGMPKSDVIDEEHPKNPINTYGQTKLFTEKILADCFKSYGFSSVCLRYFNACGADKKMRTGELHDPESHLIPIILQTLNAERSELKIYGDDYNTPDGSCIRDYVHVSDLATAHRLALEKLINSKKSLIEYYNLGTNNGFSVKEIVTAVKHNLGKDVPFKIVERRPGDPSKLVASNSKAKQDLNWNPVNSNLETILKSAWNWQLGDLRKSILNK